MKASEVIEKLQKLIDEHGDKHVHICINDAQMYPVRECKNEKDLDCFEVAN